MQTITHKILQQVESVVLGKPQSCRLALACILGQGHLLIEDLPGMGKTTLAHVLASTLGLSYQRTQFTSDLLPADIIGVSVFNRQTNHFELHKGPIFSQMLLADEINRASPKTQSSLLEAMAEKQVSIDGETYLLASPFFVIATQNPLFHAGTYPLPESQLDRFMMRISLGFPDVEAEQKILTSLDAEQAKQLGQVVSANELQTMQQRVQQVHAATDIIHYIIGLSQVTRGQRHYQDSEKISCKPLSPRAGKALLSAAKAWAYIDNRDFVLPDDVQAVFTAVCQHRIELNAEDYSDNQYRLSQQILAHVDVLNPLA